MAFDNPHSRFVAWAKIILPLIAIGLLSTLFLFSRHLDPSAAIPFAEVDVEELAREQRVGGPRFAGTTRDGTAITFAATTARPDAEFSGRILASDVVATVETPDGGILDLAARTGVIDGSSEMVEMEGDVRLETSTGYRVESDRILAALDRTRVESPGAVTAEGPAGRLTAGSLELTGGEDGYVLVFKGGVKLIYQPKY